MNRLALSTAVLSLMIALGASASAPSQNYTPSSLDVMTPIDQAADVLGAQANDDGCQKKKQLCVCGNTGWAGKCGTGPHKGGLYCRCDDRPTHHDGCKERNQACTCGNTGWAGTCNTGPHKVGLYCRCD